MIDSEIKELLRKTSRSFYLTMMVLPSSIRSQICIAYLLARATDTIADTDIVPLEIRIEALNALKRSIFEKTCGESRDPEERCCSLENPKFSILRKSQKDVSEQELLMKIERVLKALSEFSKDARKDIYDVLDIITQGQLLDLERFVFHKKTGEVLALETEEDLDDYTYRVAGCVGEFWTRICRRHLYPVNRLDEGELLKNGIAFGKGLQLVNILRDLAADIKNGRSYLPNEVLIQYNLRPIDLQKSENYFILKSYYKGKLQKALCFLECGIHYISQTPHAFNTWLMRLGCIWPILIGIRTLELLANSNPLNIEERVKVPRREVRKILFTTFIKGLIPGGWNQLMKNYLDRAVQTIGKI